MCHRLLPIDRYNGYQLNQIYRARTECNYKTEPFLLLCNKRRVFERNLSVWQFPNVSFSCLLSSWYSWMCFLSCTNSCQKTTMADFRYKSIKSWKIANIDLTQQFSLSIFTRFPLSIDKNHFIATDFYRLTTPSC